MIPASTSPQLPTKYDWAQITLYAPNRWHDLGLGQDENCLFMLDYQIFSFSLGDITWTLYFPHKVTSHKLLTAAADYYRILLSLHL